MVKRKKKVEFVEERVEDLVEDNDLSVEDINLEETVEPAQSPEPVIDFSATMSERIKTNAEKFTREFFENSKRNGCDYASNGKWQRDYAAMFNRIVSFRGKSILDIGGAFGSIAFSFFKQGAVEVVCTDISKYCVDANMFPPVIMVNAPVQDMKGVIASDKFDIVHVSHILNYVDKVDLPSAIKEIARVMKKGAVCFFVHSDEIDGLPELVKEHIGETLAVDYSKCDPDNLFFNKYKWKFIAVVKK